MYSFYIINSLVIEIAVNMSNGNLGITALNYLRCTFEITPLILSNFNCLPLF